MSFIKRIFSFYKPEDPLPPLKLHLEIDNLYPKLGWGAKGLDLIKSLRLTRDAGFNDYCILTQAYHESAGFRSVIGAWNFLGVKKPRVWLGKTCRVLTHEELRNGKREPIYGDFIDFDKCDEMVCWWVSLIKRLYKPAYGVRHIPYHFFDEISNKKNKYQYASDSLYAYKLSKVYKLLANNEVLTEILQGI